MSFCAADRCSRVGCSGEVICFRLADNVSADKSGNWGCSQCVDDESIFNSELT